MKTRQFSLGSRCLVSMNLCLFFLICNSGHCLTRVIIKNHTMLRYHFFIYLTICEFICCWCLSFSFQKKILLSLEKKKKKKKNMTEASASVCLILATALLVHDL